METTLRQGLWAALAAVCATATACADAPGAAAPAGARPGASPGASQGGGPAAGPAAQRPRDLGPIADAPLQAAASSGFGGVLMLVQSGEVRLARGYGYAERETRRPYGPDTIHDIGSITKQFTAAAVVDLVHQGKIELSAPVRTYLPTAAEPGASVTVEQLLTHRSGMPEYCGDETAQATKSAMLARCLAAPLKTGPQNGYSYSNPGYSVLAMIAEAVSGQDIDTYLKARFFRPLGMNRTGYAVPGDREAALGYDKGRRHVPLSGAEVLNGRHWNIAGNGGMQSTAADMLIWRAALLTPGGPLPEEVRRMLIQPRVKRTGSLYDGFGWAFVVDAQGAPVSMSHAGSDGVFYSYFYARPQSGDFFYLNGNNGEDEVLPLVRAIREAMIAREAARDGTP